MVTAGAQHMRGVGPACRISSKRALSTTCQAFSRPTRLASSLLTVPRRVELYFEDQPVRLAVWVFNLFGTGYYSAVSVSLSFGALAINDVVAAAVSVAFCEYVSRWYWGSPTRTVKHHLVQAFKVGAMAGLMTDAYKLSG